LPRHIFLLVLCAKQLDLVACFDPLLSQDVPVISGYVKERFTEESSKCDICVFNGSSIRDDVVPSLTKAVTRLWSSEVSDAISTVLEDHSNTCGEWSNILRDTGELTADSTDCFDLRDWLSWQCCNGMPSLSECQATVKRTRLSDDTQQMIIPITKGSSLEVKMSLHISESSIVNYGVDGGAVEVTGSLLLSWVDERLKWNSLEEGCSSVIVQESDIWVPKLVKQDANEATDTLEVSKIDVLADGRIFWTREVRMRARCNTSNEKNFQRSSRVCMVDFVDNEDNGLVRYVTGDARKVIHIDDDASIPQYTLDENQTTIVANTSATRDNVIQKVQLQLFFEPLDNVCNICDRTGALTNGTINSLTRDWIELFPEQTEEGFQCFVYNSLLNSTYSIFSEECIAGRANFEEACCDDDDTLSIFECEDNIHELIVDGLNTITPPDPSSNEQDESFATEDQVEVSVLLDVVQFIDINVQSNTFSMLVSLELQWFDKRLAWEPFIGGCHRVTYRASIDSELTEIWVPTFDLQNKLEGVQTLPEAHASVFYDGLVSWRKTGVLTATCELTGVTSFPFDDVSCYFDFGDDQDPLFHRVHFVNKENPQYFSSLTDNSFNFQEYRLLIEKTSVAEVTESLSGFENSFIRYRFFFDRAEMFYVHMFVVIYISFTYLSFGIFFVDSNTGERLGFVTSILFLLVAQDITLAELTPITQEFLWIGKLSLGSKCAVLLVIVHSLVILWALTRDIEESEQYDERQEENISLLGATPIAQNEEVQRSVDLEGSSVPTNRQALINDTEENEKPVERQEKDKSAIGAAPTTQNEEVQNTVDLEESSVSKNEWALTKDIKKNELSDERREENKKFIGKAVSAQNEEVQSTVGWGMTSFFDSVVLRTKSDSGEGCIKRSLRKGIDMYCSVGNIFLGYKIDEADPKRLALRKKAKMADATSCLICFLGYTIFMLSLLGIGIAA